jgi:hypothetical protein
MNTKDIDQVSGYARLMVRELHDVVMDEEVYEKLKVVLLLAEELEIYMEYVKTQQKVTFTYSSNIVQFKRRA